MKDTFWMTAQETEDELKSRQLADIMINCRNEGSFFGHAVPYSYRPELRKGTNLVDAHVEKPAQSPSCGGNPESTSASSFGLHICSRIRGWLARQFNRTRHTIASYRGRKYRCERDSSVCSGSVDNILGGILGVGIPRAEPPKEKASRWPAAIGLFLCLAVVVGAIVMIGTKGRATNPSFTGEVSKDWVDFITEFSDVEVSPLKYIIVGGPAVEVGVFARFRHVLNANRVSPIKNVVLGSNHALFAAFQVVKIKIVGNCAGQRFNENMILQSASRCCAAISDRYLESPSCDVWRVFRVGNPQICDVWRKTNEGSLNLLQTVATNSILFDHLAKLSRIYQSDTSAYSNSRDLKKELPILLPWFFALLGFCFYSYSLWQVKPSANHGALWFFCFFLGLAIFMYGVYGILRSFGGF